MFTNKELEKRTEELQNLCHTVVEEILKRTKKTTYQDATNTWLFAKLAELDLRLEKLESNKVSNN